MFIKVWKMILHSIDKSLQILIFYVYRTQYNILFVLQIKESIVNDYSTKGGKQK